MKIPATLLMVGLMLVTAATAQADEQKSFTLADGKLTVSVPEAWKVVTPRSRIIDTEMKVPAAEGDEIDGRVTVMGAGGSVQANIDRWIGQFSQPDGGSSKEKTKTTKKTVAGKEVHIVDVTGTYADSPGPFAPAVQRPNYRMLAAIVTTKGDGNYFIKFYGPEKTVTNNAAAFNTMINSIKAVK